MSGDALKEKLAAYFAEPEKRVFRQRREIRPEEVSLSRGVSLELRAPGIPETALEELITVLNGWRIPRSGSGLPLRLEERTGFAGEEFLLEIRPEEVSLHAAGTEGFRRGIYFLAGRLENAP